LDILGVLGADGVASEAVRVAGCCKSNVTYWKNKFLKAGALRLKVDGIVKYYELTGYGSKLLTGSDDVVRLPVLLEDHAVKFRHRDVLSGTDFVAQVASRRAFLYWLRHLCLIVHCQTLAGTNADTGATIGAQTHTDYFLF